MVIWNYRTLFGVETPTFDKVHSILADHSFNLDVNALVGKVHTIWAKRKTISAESIQFRKCLIGFCKRFPSSRLPSLGRLLSKLPCDSPWVFPDRPNFPVKQTCDPVSNQRCCPNSGGQLQVKVQEGTVSSLPGTLNVWIQFCHSTGIARSGGGVRASTTSYA